MYVFVKNPRTVLTLVLYQTQAAYSVSNKYHVPLLWGLALSLNGTRLSVLASLGEDACVPSRWLVMTKPQIVQRSGNMWIERELAASHIELKSTMRHCGLT